MIFAFVGQRLHAKIGTPGQHLALMIASHPYVSCFAAGPVVLIYKVELESRFLRLLETGPYRIEPFIR